MSFQVTIQSTQHQFPAEADQSVLDAALAAGLVLPYSCRTGACSTCKGKVVSGEIDAGQYPAQILSPEELAEGYTLFCQAHAKSDLVIAATEVRMASDIQIRKLPVQMGTPIIFLTTESDDALKQEARAAGATGWLVKPFQPDQLLRIAKKVLGR